MPRRQDKRSGRSGPQPAIAQQTRSEQLQNYCDLKTVEMLGKGAYGFVPLPQGSSYATACHSMSFGMESCPGFDMPGQGTQTEGGQELRESLQRHGFISHSKCQCPDAYAVTRL